MKDPAFLFYPADFVNGTQYFTLEEKGAYIQLLLLQFSEGKLTDFLIRRSLGDAYERTWEVIKCKFTFDGNHYWNERLETEKQKRAKFTESRRNNLKSTSHMDSHMKPHMEDININVNRNVIKEERIVQSSNEPTLDEVKHFFESNGFETKHAENFYSYYSGQEWRTTSGISIKKNWQKKVIGWMNNQKQFGDKNGTKSSGNRRKDYVTKDEYESELKSLYEG